MNHKLIIIIITIAFSSIAAKADILFNDTTSLSLDKDITIGRLSNGLTYYLRPNDYPSKSVSFYLVQRVGSMQEEEQQRGLAHFLEHMCFDGSKHFEGNGIQKFCERLGVNYGEELNAYTTYEETVFNIDNVPSAVGMERLDSCLLVLADWAHGLTLDSASIAKERGIIHEEWRQDRGASDRIYERQLPKMFPNSRYSCREPIGLMSVIDNFDPKELRDFYDKWYNPENQCVIVVGDIDVNHIEKKIKEIFSGELESTSTTLLGIVTPTEVPDTKGVVVHIDKDKELDGNSIAVRFKHDTHPRNYYTTLKAKKDNYIVSAALYMLNVRLDDESMKDDCPFTSAEVDDNSYSHAQTKDAFAVYINMKDGKETEALTSVMKIIRQAAEFGFTQSEFDRYNVERVSSLRNALLAKDKISNKDYIVSCKNNYLHGYDLMSFTDDIETRIAIAENSKLDDVNRQMRQLLPIEDDNMFISLWNVEKDGKIYPSEKEILSALKKGREAQISPYVDNLVTMDIIRDEPVDGEIVEEQVDTVLGTTHLTLSNGIKVILKHTDFDKSEVLMSAWGKGGWSQYEMDDIPTLGIFNQMTFGLNGMSSSQVEKYLAGKQVMLRTSLKQRTFNLSGASSPNDLETLLKLVYARFICPLIDSAACKKTIQDDIDFLINTKDDPDGAFSDSIYVTDHSHNPYYMPKTVESIKKADLHRVLEILRHETGSPQDYTFVFVGNYDEEKIRPLLKHYLASLPQRDTVRNMPYINYFPQNNVLCHFKHEMQTPKTSVEMTWLTESLPFSIENFVTLQFVAQMMNIIYDEKVREATGMTYDCSMTPYNVYVIGEPLCLTSLSADCTMKPEGRDKLMKIMKSEFEAFANNIDLAMLQNVRENMLKDFDINLKENGTWNNAIILKEKKGIDSINTKRDIISNMTADKISAFVKTLLNKGHYTEVLMEPQQ